MHYLFGSNAFSEILNCQQDLLTRHDDFGSHGLKKILLVLPLGNLGLKNIDVFIGNLLLAFCTPEWTPASTSATVA